MSMVHPWRGGVAQVERFEGRFVVSGGVAEYHRVAREISMVGRLADHLFDAVAGTSAILRPLARLRCGASECRSPGWVSSASSDHAAIS